MTRLAILLPEDPASGAGQRAHHLSRGLAGRGWQVAGGLVPRGFRAAQTQGDAAALAFMHAETGRLVEQWTQWRPDVVHVEVPGPEAMPWRWAAAHLALPLTCAWHWMELFVAAERREQVRGQNLEFLRACRRVHVRTPTQRDALPEIPGERLDVVPNGVDCTAFNPAHRDPTLRRSWGVADDSPVILHVGRLLPEKGLGLLAEAWQAIVATTPRAHLVVVGDGSGQADLATRCPTARFLGVQRGNDLARIYASAEVFLFPSRADSWGMVLTEALASGLACVAFPLGAAGQLLQSRRNGELADDDADFIARSVALVADAGRIAANGREARLTALQHSWERAASALSTSLLRACG